MTNLGSLSLGIFLALIATICFSMGFVFQKIGLTQGLPELNFELGLKKTFDDFTKFFSNKTWMLGILLGFIGWFPYVIAVSLVGILVVQPITSLGLIIFLISAHKLIGESISFKEFISAGLLIIAPIMIALAKISNINIDLYDFLTPFLIYFSISIIFSIFFYSFSNKVKANLKGVFLAITGVILNANATIFTNIIAQAYSDANINIFSWFGWLEVLFGIFWFDYSHIWLFFSLWGMILFFILGLIFYQSAFQKGKASIIYLIINSFSIIIPILVGLFIFNQSFANLYLFIIAIGLIFIAVLSLSKYQADIENIKTIKDNKKVLY